VTRQPFPLQWPEGYKRTPTASRTKSRFGFHSSGQVSLVAARNQLFFQMSRLGAVNVVLTTDLPVRGDGLPYANGRADDPGVAVWFVLPDDRGNSHTKVFACDRWRTHAENMMAIAKSVEAMRGLDRWGMSEIVERTMGGFAALPSGEPSGPTKKPWREVLFANGPLGVGGDLGLEKGDVLVLAKSRHRALIKQHHPDAGGSAELAAEINAALAEAEAELGEAS
jgi:hypothetical protein